MKKDTVVKQKSFRDLLAEGTAARVNAMKFRIEDIHEEPGFNLREEGEDLDASIEALADFIAAGGTYPPVEIRIRQEGGVWLVDGHRRRRAILKCIERGVPLADKNGDVWVNVTAFEGNDVKRAARILTSDERKTLGDLERARGYQRLAAYGLSSTEIAAEVGRSRPHVEQMLILANANRDVHELVRGGKVTASAAIEVVRKHGEEAGALLGGKVAEKGGAKLKESDVKGKALPRKVVDEVADALGWFKKHGLNAEQRKAVAQAEKDPQQHAEVVVEVTAGALAELMKAAGLVEDTRKQQKAKAAEKAAKSSQAEIAEDGEEA